MAVESIRGNLSTTGRLRANLAVGGGSDVSITPTYNSGIKIADFNIDGSEGAIYVPENEPRIDILLNEVNAVNIGTTYTFLNNHTLSEYDAIEIIIATKENVTDGLGYDHWYMSVRSVLDYPIINYGAYGNRWFYGTFTNTTFMQNNTDGDQYPYVFRIYGIKY